MKYHAQKSLIFLPREIFSAEKFFNHDSVKEKNSSRLTFWWRENNPHETPRRIYEAKWMIPLY